MIRGYFSSSDPQAHPSPYVNGLVNFPSIGISEMEVQFLVDSGANDTVLGHYESHRIVNGYGVDLTGLPMAAVPGVGGSVSTRLVQAELEFDGFVAHLLLPVLELMHGQPPSIPSLLGRDILSHFALFMEERTDRVLLLEPHESDRLGLE